MGQRIGITLNELTRESPMLGILPWCIGPVECLACGAEWVEAWPLGCAALYCPDCGSDDTYREIGG